MAINIQKAGYNFSHPSACYSQSFPVTIFDNVDMILNSAITVTYTTAHIAHYFKSLVSRVIDECYLTASPTKMISNTSFNTIVGMGENVIPLLIEQLDFTPMCWIPALNLITKTNPIKEENQGIVSNMVNDWKKWAIDNGYTNK
ncbi:MAG TPA: hypothetical protein VN721_04545 [Flavipsychrobacter sp.]|nr:hypothetical protein [Flavipsychrobacter sp.]